jgi:hypothetical protein
MGPRSGSNCRRASAGTPRSAARSTRARRLPCDEASHATCPRCRRCPTHHRAGYRVSRSARRRVNIDPRRNPHHRKPGTLALGPRRRPLRPHSESNPLRRGNSLAARRGQKQCGPLLRRRRPWPARATRPLAPQQRRAISPPGTPYRHTRHAHSRTQCALLAGIQCPQASARLKCPDPVTTAHSRTTLCRSEFADCAEVLENPPPARPRDSASDVHLQALFLRRKRPRVSLSPAM